MTSLTPNNIIDFWFSDRVKPLQFAKNNLFDKEIHDKFITSYEQAYSGSLNDWQQTAEGSLALVILMDQFPHNMFRNKKRAFEAEYTALTISKKAIQKNFDKKISPEQRLFLYMPFMHSEDLAEQELSMKLYATKDMTSLEFAISHHDIVKCFGRFPHRNIVLNRISTPEEIEFLKGPNSSF